MELGEVGVGVGDPFHLESSGGGGGERGREGGRGRLGLKPATWAGLNATYVTHTHRLACIASVTSVLGGAYGAKWTNA